MKKVFITLVFMLLMLNTSMAQKTQVEVVKSINPSEDARPNNPEVPEVITQSGSFERIVVVRLKNKTDILEALNTAAKKENIKDAVILSGAGSATGYHYHVVSNGEFPSKNYYIKNPDHPVDICNMSGFVIDGRVHAHITFSDDERAFGGHLEPGTNVFTFSVITIGVLGDDIDLSRADDKTYR
jgi:uncharacterized protein